MTSLVRQSVCRTVGALSLATVMAGCGSSSPPASTGPAPTPDPHAREIDNFAYTVVGDSTWKIWFGEIAAYFLGASGRATEFGPAIGAASPPVPITTRLLTDTLVVADTLAGPPGGTDLLAPSYVAYDNARNLWMSAAGSHGDGKIVEYTLPQTSQSGSLLPNTTLTGATAPLGLAFDPQGNLWVVDSAMTALLEYGVTRLQTGGTPNASISLGGITAAGATWAPLDVSADAQGNLWVSARPRTLPAGAAADSVPAYVVAEFTAAAIAGGGTPTPALTLVQAGAHQGGYGPGMAFDPSGNLWTANANLTTMTRFSAASLVGGANPSPTITIGGTTLSGVGDIAVDSAGVLYVGGSAYGSPGAGIFVYAPKTITTSGSPTPKLSYTPPGGINHFAIR
jgi:hypothetical protein